MENLDSNNKDILGVLLEIRDILSRIYVCFEDEYLEIQRQRYGEKIKIFESLLNENRQKIYPLLFDPKQLSQSEIAQSVGTTQPTVSRFITLLLENELIEEYEEKPGIIIYRDKYDLLKILREQG